jgi:HD superfamily phosphohydrolase
LVHDLGHFPYTHSLKELPLKDHETLTAELVQDGTLAGCLRSGGIAPLAVATIIDHALPCSDPELAFYRSVLSGVLDPDKLDYLNRDAYFCGVPYGVQDLDFILGNIRVHQGQRIAIRHAGLSSIEHLLFSKYLMYRAVYWHRQVRTATAMIKRALFVSLREGSIRPEELYHLEDARFTDLAERAEKRTPALQLVRQVAGRHLLATVLELPYRQDCPQLAGLCDLDCRHRAEAEIARMLPTGRNGALADWQVVVDIPEAISFESDMPVETQEGIVPYLDSGTVFTAGVVRDFTDSLRIVRVMADIGPAGISDSCRRMVRELLTGNGHD